MRAMVLRAPGEPLQEMTREIPTPGKGEVLIRVKACAVCRTDLHVVDGDLNEAALPVVPGHEVVGTVEACDDDTEGFEIGDRVGVPWLGWTCGKCHYCLGGLENLCEQAEFTGYTRDGGFAEYIVADFRYCFRLPDSFSDIDAAPLMCAGLIGYRAYRMVGEAKNIGLYGFGAAAHILTQVACHQNRNVHAFTKKGDLAAQAFAVELGAIWAGDSDDTPPQPLDAAIIFAPVGSLLPAALSVVDKGGTVICAGIHMSDIPSFPYDLLWHERTVRSVANLTREDGEEFLEVAPEVPVKTVVHPYSLSEANKALEDLRLGNFEGAAVLAID
ncbi:MAG: zinc-dependent alcohol dehydrogenase family protein [Proteobacteria bacterium]|nr:zinc-dependent alcohol dehydrogenase family protein [Pseudomonadota bacterium]